MAKHHTESEIAWAKEQIQLSPNGWTKANLLELLKTYNQKFHKNNSYNAFRLWLSRVKDPSKYKRMAEHFHKTSRVKGIKVFDKSNFIVCIMGNVYGFETEPEVKEFLINSQILSGVTAFRKVNIDVKYQINIGD